MRRLLQLLPACNKLEMLHMTCYPTLSRAPEPVQWVNGVCPLRWLRLAGCMNNPLLPVLAANAPFLEHLFITGFGNEYGTCGDLHLPFLCSRMRAPRLLYVQCMCAPSRPLEQPIVLPSTLQEVDVVFLARDQQMRAEVLSYGVGLLCAVPTVNITLWNPETGFTSFHQIDLERWCHILGLNVCRHSMERRL